MAKPRGGHAFLVAAGILLSRLAGLVRERVFAHYLGTSAAGGAFRAVASPDSQSSPDGNAVVVEEQMMKVGETQMAYAEAAGLYKKMFSMWRTALNGHG